VDPSAKWLAQSPAFEGKEKLVTATATKLLSDRRIPPLELLPQTASELQIALPELDAAGSLALGSAIVLEATKLSRRRVVGALSPFPLDLFGDEGWLGQLPPQARYHPRLDYYVELSKVYAETAVNINATNYQMPTAVNQRVFDAPLAGGFLISDNQEDLQLLFDPDEYVIYSRLSDLTDEVRFYLPQISLRMRVAEKAAERILAEHTFRHRIKTIINYARKAFGSRDFTNVRTAGGAFRTETAALAVSTS
jgi:spore maturation protein CgeB